MHCSCCFRILISKYIINLNIRHDIILHLTAIVIRRSSSSNCRRFSEQWTVFRTPIKARMCFWSDIILLIASWKKRLVLRIIWFLLKLQCSHSRQKFKEYFWQASTKSFRWSGLFYLSDLFKTLFFVFDLQILPEKGTFYKIQQ